MTNPSKWAYWKRNQRAQKGRKKNRNSVVHHVDGNPANNSPYNLRRISRSKHRAEHNRPGPLKTSPGRKRR